MSGRGSAHGYRLGALAPRAVLVTVPEILAAAVLRYPLSHIEAPYLSLDLPVKPQREGLPVAGSKVFVQPRKLAGNHSDGR